MIVANQAAYRMKITRADDPRSLNAYDALENSAEGRLVIPLETESEARMKIQLDDSDATITVEQFCVDTVRVKKIVFKFYFAAGGSRKFTVGDFLKFYC